MGKSNAIHADFNHVDHTSFHFILSETTQSIDSFFVVNNIKGSMQEEVIRVSNLIVPQ